MAIAMARRFSRTRAAIGLLVAILPHSARALDRHVPADFPSIQAAIDDSGPGDNVLVAPGTYYESLRFNGRAVGVRSTQGATVTTVVGVGGATVVMGPGGELNGFTITGGFASFGAGMEVDGAGSLIKNNIFDGNMEYGGGFGAGIGGNNSSPVIDSNVFRYNSCDTQFLSGVVAFVNTSSPRIVNNIFHDNPCRAINMSLPEGSMPEIINNTMVRNPVGIRVDARIRTAAQVYRNNIIVQNTVGLQVDFGSPVNDPTWENNLVFGNGADYAGIADQTGFAGNISVDPVMVDSVGGDFHVRPGSPAVDAGTSLQAPGADFDDNPRPVDGDCDGRGAVDLGAYELRPIPACDDYLCYQAAVSSGEPEFGAVQTTLEDQLGTSIFEVTKIDRLCNPAQKNAESPPTRPTVHEVGYQIKLATTAARSKFVPSDHTAIDEFGSHPLTLVKPAGTLVPSAKALGSDGIGTVDTTGVDHFECYKTVAARGAEKTRAVTAADEFGSFTYDLTRITRLCTPANKDGDDPSAPQHPRHLVCYRARITARQTKLQRRTVSVNNISFGPAVLVTRARVELCVPGFKDALPTTTSTTSTTTFTTTTSTTTSTTSTTVPACTFVLTWGSGEFNGPAGVATDNGGTVYVTDFYNNRVQKFDATGSFITTWGTLGSGDGQFNNPYGVATDSNGNVYVSDTGNDRIQKFDARGTFLTMWGTSGSSNGQFNTPAGVATDGSANVYVTDFNNHRIEKFDASGTFLTTWGTIGSANGQFYFPGGVATDGRGNVYVADTNNNRVQKFDTSGGFLTTWGGFSSPYGVAADGSGHVYVSDYYHGRIDKFDTSGTFLGAWGTPGSGDGQFNNPRGLATDASGNIYVADHGNNRIQKFACP